MKLLVHHHAVAFRDSENVIWLPAFIGRWINALAPNCETIGLLLYESEEKSIHQDESISADNVEFYSLGVSSKQSYLRKRRRLKKICSDASMHADALLIRGITPRQKAVADAVTVANKALLLVGSLSERTKPNFQLSFRSLYTSFMYYYRPIELQRLAKSGINMLGNSPKIVDEIVTILHVPASFVPTNSIRRDEFPPLAYREVHVQPRLLFCGRVVTDKGVTELFHAVQRLAHVTLDIVGYGATHDMTLFYELSEKLGIKDRIHWHGAIEYGDELFGYYREADLMVLPTYHEGFPHVIWEAAANSCPVVTTEVGGIPSLWENEVHGLLVPPRNVDRLVEAIVRLLTNDHLRHALVFSAYYHALDYTVENCSTMTLDTLNMLWRK